MKLIKSPLFLLALLVACVTAISSTQSIKAAKKFDTGFVIVKYDCTSVVGAIPQEDPAEAQALVSPEDVEDVCPGGDTEVCARLQEWSDVPNANIPLIKQPNGSFIFNSSHTGGLSGAYADFTTEYLCD